ncbi:MAG: ABC transporter ATP-binding protein [Clostridiales bacterium]|nr:ABC transporter ATP-binding protein [Clostridiales bacterium]
MLTVSNVSFAYRRRNIIQDVSFTLNSGEALVIAGPNGCGKSTLLSVLSGALPGYSGSIRLDGERLGMVPQGNAVFEDLTVLENLQFFSRLAHKPLKRPLPMGLERFADRKAGQLSGGYQKRLAIACTQVSDPDIWLFDEPCASLDIVWRDEMVGTILALKNAGHGIVYVGHDPAEFISFYDAILFLQNGHGRLIHRSEIPQGTEYTLFQQLIRASAG